MVLSVFVIQKTNIMQHELNIHHEGLSGQLSVKMANGQTLDDFCTDHLHDYNRDRFEALAIRVYLGGETIITVYAVDKLRQEGSSVNVSKIPVKKFKLSTLSVNELFSYCAGFNFTLSTGNYALEDMEITNR